MILKFLFTQIDICDIDKIFANQNKLLYHYSKEKWQMKVKVNYLLIIFFLKIVEIFLQFSPSRAIEQILQVIHNMLSNRFYQKI